MKGILWNLFINFYVIHFTFWKSLYNVHNTSTILAFECLTVILFPDPGGHWSDGVKAKKNGFFHITNSKGYNDDLKKELLISPTGNILRIEIDETGDIQIFGPLLEPVFIDY